MNKQLCKLYGESSRDFANNVDAHTKQNIELLANLAVMELQFMRIGAPAVVEQPPAPSFPDSERWRKW